MKENRYDDPEFFDRYSNMARSVNGLRSAGEWHTLEQMLPEFTGKRVLDLGCGFGWHCRYAAEHGASCVVGTDISRKMIDRARLINAMPQIEYRVEAIEEADFAPGSFDIIISSLALHYIESFGDIARKAYEYLTPGGSFIFSAEHPVFTARGDQQWYSDEQGRNLHWPVDRYYDEGKREAVFLGEKVVKYHKTMTTYINGTLGAGFCIKEFREVEPSQRMIEEVPGMEDELRRPMMFVLSAVKQ